MENVFFKLEFCAFRRRVLPNFGNAKVLLRQTAQNSQSDKKGMFISMENYVNGPQVPLGLGMALGKNTKAMSAFSALSVEEKQKVIEHTHQIQSKAEMAEFAQEIADGFFFPLNTV